MKTKIILTLLYAAFFIGCRSSKNVKLSKDDTIHWFLSIEQTPCFGKCPIYLLSVNSLGISHFDGKRFVTPIGKYTSTISDTKYNDLKKLTSNVDWKEYDTEYISGYTDLPSTILRYSVHPLDTFTITFENNLAPKDLVHLASRLNEYRLSAEWKPKK